MARGVKTGAERDRKLVDDPIGLVLASRLFSLTESHEVSILRRSLEIARRRPYGEVRDLQLLMHRGDDNRVMVYRLALFD